MPGADDLSLPDCLPRATASPEEGPGEPHQVDHCTAGQQQEGEGHLYTNDPSGLVTAVRPNTKS